MPPKTSCPVSLAQFLEKAEPMKVTINGQVQRAGTVPTPALYYAVAARGLDGGMQITGSHNPPEFNGFKMAKKKLPLFGAEIQGMKRMVETGDFDKGAAKKFVIDPHGVVK